MSSENESNNPRYEKYKEELKDITDKTVQFLTNINKKVIIVDDYNIIQCIRIIKGIYYYKEPYYTNLLEFYRKNIDNNKIITGNEIYDRKPKKGTKYKLRTGYMSENNEYNLTENSIDYYLTYNTSRDIIYNVKNYINYIFVFIRKGYAVFEKSLIFEIYTNDGNDKPGRKVGTITLYINKESKMVEDPSTNAYFYIFEELSDDTTSQETRPEIETETETETAIKELEKDPDEEHDDNTGGKRRHRNRRQKTRRNRKPRKNHKKSRRFRR